MTNDVQRVCAVFATLWQGIPSLRGKKYFITKRDRGAAKALMQGGQVVQTSEVVERFRSYAKSAFWSGRNFPAYGLFDHFSEFLPVVYGERATSTPALVIECFLCGRSHHADSSCNAEDLPGLKAGGTFSTVEEALRDVTSALTGALARGVDAQFRGSYRCSHCGEVHSPRFVCSGSSGKAPGTSKEAVGKPPTAP